MMQHSYRNTEIAMLILVVLLLGIVILIAIQSTSAQEISQNNDMRELLEELNAKIERETQFQIGFKFAHPLGDNDEQFWSIPYGPPDEDTSRWIGEIGDDFICFYEQAGSAGIAHCTPFANIVSISYLGSP